jgi:hypothetical protein
MRRSNPMSNPATLEKMRASMKGRPFVQRGGNGQLTKQQRILAERLGLPTELPVPTRDVRHMFGGIPTAYKVDLADPATKTAIEVDGKTHRLPKRRAQDEKKDAVLRALGWSVLRFWNQEIDENLDSVCQQIRECITSRSK